jgi:hypothetical protein
MIKLANGKQYQTIVLFSHKELFQGQQREVLEIHFKADETGEDGYTMEEIAALYRNTAPLDDIKIYEDAPDEEGNYIFLSEHLHFTIAIKFWAETVDEIPRYVIKVAQMSNLEITQQEQGAVLTALLQGV